MAEDRHLSTAIEAAHRAGRVLQQWAGRFTVTEKSPANLVTEADLAAQAAIVEVIRPRFPDHALLGEEGLDERSSEQAFRWIIDPLDGTSNYVHGFPYYAVSIGLQQDTEMVLGVIFDPNRNETFVAQRGHGSWLNGVKIRTSTVETLSRAFVVASLPPGSSCEDVSVRRLLQVLPHAQTVQRTGSAALNLAYVACGRIDGFWSSSLKPWDVAAGSLIVTEGAGVVSRMNGDAFDPMISDLLATNGADLQGELKALLGS
jgi:myo-inositol-1(or 4)-monophosphatase